jgi:hypothetical protein
MRRLGGRVVFHLDFIRPHDGECGGNCMRPAPPDVDPMLVTPMTASHLPLRDHRVVEPMIALARCTPLHRIIVAGAKSIELVFELQRRGFARAASTANCGRPAGQYDAALIDWRRRTFRDLQQMLDWVVDFIAPAGVLVVWVDPQKPVAMEALRTALMRRGLFVESATVRVDGYAVSARRSETRPISKAA